MQITMNAKLLYVPPLLNKFQVKPVCYFRKQLPSKKNKALIHGHHNLNMSGLQYRTY